MCIVCECTCGGGGGRRANQAEQAIACSRWPSIGVLLQSLHERTARSPGPACAGKHSRRLGLAGNKRPSTSVRIRSHERHAFDSYGDAARMSKKRGEKREGERGRQHGGAISHAGRCSRCLTILSARSGPIATAAHFAAFGQRRLGNVSEENALSTERAGRRA